ncbi:acetyltransferase-like isoleucine patch superfamily enzyme [Methylobacterium sp. OAE515]|uniref:acyltransferase n=1 Tax=Methylobacterium sp. OAE515 TaxID=2817895 RepID=UPI001789A20A
MLEKTCDVKVSSRTIASVREALSANEGALGLSEALNIKNFYDKSADLGNEWMESGNILISAEPDLRLNIVAHPGGAVPRCATIIVGKNQIPPGVIMVWGYGAIVVLGDEVCLPTSGLYCGGRSSILIEGHISCAGEARLNARNGGSIEIGKSGLWSNKVYMSTDDMHAILDQKTGKRINPYGGRISIKQHVWLGLETMVLGGAQVGVDCVIGARSVVKGSIPDGSIAAGSPARVIRQGVTWSQDDIIPEVV